MAYPRKNGQCTSPGKFQGDSPTTGVCMLPLAAQTTMPKPCEGGPSNPWCPADAAGGACQNLPLTSTGRRVNFAPLLLAILGAGTLVSGVAWRRRRGTLS